MVAWFGGIALGLSAGMALVLVGNSVFKALASERFLEGSDGREAREKLE